MANSAKAANTEVTTQTNAKLNRLLMLDTLGGEFRDETYSIADDHIATDRPPKRPAGIKQSFKIVRISIQGQPFSTILQEL